MADLLAIGHGHARDSILGIPALRLGPGWAQAQTLIRTPRPQDGADRRPPAKRRPLPMLTPSLSRLRPQEHETGRENEQQHEQDRELSLGIPPHDSAGSHQGPALSADPGLYQARQMSLDLGSDHTSMLDSDSQENLLSSTPSLDSFYTASSCSAARTPTSASHSLATHHFYHRAPDDQPGSTSFHAKMGLFKLGRSGCLSFGKLVGYDREAETESAILPPPRPVFYARQPAANIRDRARVSHNPPSSRAHHAPARARSHPSSTDGSPKTASPLPAETASPVLATAKMLLQAVSGKGQPVSKRSPAGKGLFRRWARKLKPVSNQDEKCSRIRPAEAPSRQQHSPPPPENSPSDWWHFYWKPLLTCRPRLADPSFKPYTMKQTGRPEEERGRPCCSPNQPQFDTSGLLDHDFPERAASTQADEIVPASAPWDVAELPNPPSSVNSTSPVQDAAEPTSDQQGQPGSRILFGDPSSSGLTYRRLKRRPLRARSPKAGSSSARRSSTSASQKSSTNPRLTDRLKSAFSPNKTAAPTRSPLEAEPDARLPGFEAAEAASVLLQSFTEHPAGSLQCPLHPEYLFPDEPGPLGQRQRHPGNRLPDGRLSLRGAMTVLGQEYYLCSQSLAGHRVEGVEVGPIGRPLNRWCVTHGGCEVHS